MLAALLLAATGGVVAVVGVVIAAIALFLAPGHVP